MSARKNHIIVPTDFSEQSIVALNQSYNLARLTNSIITLVSVIDEDAISSVLHLFSDKESQINLIKAGIEGKLKELANEARAKSGLEFAVRIERGKIYDEIVRVAEELNASFIIMGTNGVNSIKKSFIGSNAARVIKEAHCPVITIKGTEHLQGCQTIVLPLDLTKETKEKVGKCIEIAKFFNSTVNVLTVMVSEDEFLVNKLTRQMEQVTDYITGEGVKCVGDFVHNKSVSDGVLEYSKKVDADLIIIMTQKETEWTPLFIGSESQQVINHSEIPVCSIHPIPKKDTTDFVIS